MPAAAGLAFSSRLRAARSTQASQQNQMSLMLVPAPRRTRNSGTQRWQPSDAQRAIERSFGDFVALHVKVQPDFAFRHRFERRDLLERSPAARGGRNPFRRRSRAPRGAPAAGAFELAGDVGQAGL